MTAVMVRRLPVVGMLVIAGAVGVAVPVLLAMPADRSLVFVLPIIAAANAALLWIAWRSRTPAGRMGGSFLVPAVMPVLGLGGFWWYLNGGVEKTLAEQGGGVVGNATLEPDQYLATLALWFVASCGFLIGSRCWRGDLDRTSTFRADLSEGLAPLRTIVARYSGLLLLGAALPAVLIVVGYGPPGLLERAAYRTETQEVLFLKIGSTLSMAGAVTGATLYALPLPRSRRQLALAIFVLYLVLNYAMTTRELALAPAAWLLGSILGRGTFPRFRVFLLVGVATLMLYSVPLNNRALPRTEGQHGLIPYAVHNVTHPDLFFGIDLELGTRNVFQTFGVAGHVAFNAEPIETRYFVANINPAPSGLSGWNDVSQDNKITRYAPYSALGALSNHGPLYLLGTTMALGAGLGAIDRAARRVRYSAGLLIRVASSGVGGLLVFQFIQYHLRTTARLAEVAIIAALAIAAFDRSQQRQQARAVRAPRPASRTGGAVTAGR